MGTGEEAMPPLQEALRLSRKGKGEREDERL